MPTIDNYISALAKKLDPYIRTIVRNMLGDYTGSSTAFTDSNKTYIRGTGWQKNDLTGDRTGTSMDTGSYSSESSSTYGCFGGHSAIAGGYQNYIKSGESYSGIVAGSTNYVSGSYSVIVGGVSNTIYGADYGAILGGSYNDVDASYSVACGSDNEIDQALSFAMGSYAIVSNAHTFCIGNGEVAGDAQTSICELGSTVSSMSSSWQEIGAERDDRTEFEIGKVTNYYTAWTFTALITGAEYQLASLYSYRIDGVVKRGNSTTPELVTYIVTTIYSDNDSFEVVPAISSSYMVFNVRDTANGGANVMWNIAMWTSECMASTNLV